MKVKYLFIGGLIALILDIVLKTHTAVGVMVAGLYAGQYDDSMQSYRKLLDTKMRKVAWNKSYWSQFMGFVGGKKSMFDSPTAFGTKGPQKATGAPIEVLQDFKYMGRGTMDIPIFYPLVGKGKSGSMTLVGTGERAKIANMQVSINQKRQAYLAQDSKMSKQLLQSPEMVKKLVRSAADYLGDWFQRWMASQAAYSFLEGYSENLVLPASEGGLGIPRQSHMNIYGSGFGTVGRVAFNNTAATYEANVAAALGAMTLNLNPFSTSTVENAVFVARHQHRLAPIEVEGQNVYPMVISAAAALQLQQDTKWNDRGKYAAERSVKSNPLYTGRIAGIYAGVLIIVDETVPSAYINGDTADSYQTAAGVVPFQISRSTTGDTTGVCYGVGDSVGDPAFMAFPTDTGNRKPWILFGKSAIACGVANDISFEDEEYDFKQKKEVGADLIIGFQRSDIVDTDGYFGVTGDKRYENVSSVIGFTFSPTTATW